MNDLEQLVQGAVAEFGAAPNPAELENAKARYLGKAGRVTELLKGMAALPPEQKKTRGAEINQAKTRIETALAAARDKLATSAAWAACTR
jgi:phenylalanyl-tRNA synthetase alpha chain